MTLQWKLILYGLLALSLSVLILVVNGWREKANKLEAAESALSSAIVKCESDKKITENANDALSKDRDAISLRLASLLQQPSQCVQPTGAAHSGKGGAGHAAANVSSAWLLNYGAQCENYRSEVIVLDKFLDDEKVH